MKFIHTNRNHYNILQIVRISDPKKIVHHHQGNKPDTESWELELVFGTEVVKIRRRTEYNAHMVRQELMDFVNSKDINEKILNLTSHNTIIELNANREAM